MTTDMITIVDIGTGNLGSILNMLRRIKASAKVTSSIADIESADKLILPGVGAFDNAMKNLDRLGLIDVLNKRVQEHRAPILGICLGLQLFARRSEEGILPGLGWLNAEVVRFRSDGQSDVRIPHMGWNTTTLEKDDPLFADMKDETRFYFVHSYHLVCREPTDVLTTTQYGHEFVSSVARDNVRGVQFHPEKSHRFGMKLLENFARLI